MGVEAYEQYLESLRRKRAPAVFQAARLIDAGEFDQAERLVTDGDDSIHGAVALARLYRATLEQARNSVRLVADASCRATWRDEVYRRSVRWACQALPEPHTAVEAEQFEQARQQAKAELESIWRSGLGEAESAAEVSPIAPAQGAL